MFFVKEPLFSIIYFVENRIVVVLVAVLAVANAVLVVANAVLDEKNVVFFV
jgi:hypothetical protein